VSSCWAEALCHREPVGIRPDRPMHLTIRSPGMPGYPKDTSGFESAPATGDVNGDGYG
jgi:hypothetical protein